MIDIITFNTSVPGAREKSGASRAAGPTTEAGTAPAAAISRKAASSNSTMLQGRTASPNYSTSIAVVRWMLAFLVVLLKL